MDLNPVHIVDRSFFAYLQQKKKQIELSLFVYTY